MLDPDISSTVITRISTCATTFPVSSSNDPFEANIIEFTNSFGAEFAFLFELSLLGTPVTQPDDIFSLIPFS